MSRPRVVPIIPPRSRQLWTPDIWMPPPKDADHAAAVMRVNARLAQRAAAKASADVMRVQARLAQRAAAKASAPSVGAMRPEVPRVSRVPRVASQQWQNAPTLESKESSLKAIRQTVPARSDKLRAVLNLQPRNGPAGRCLTPRPMDFLVDAPMAPRASRLRGVDVSPLAFSPSRMSKGAKSILRGGSRQQKRGEEKKVSFGDVETKEVERWIGIVQGVESDNQLFDEQGRRCKGRFVHVFPDPNRR